MKSLISALLGFVFAIDCLGATIIGSPSRYVETAIPRSDMCAGNFKARAEGSKLRDHAVADSLATRVSAPITWNNFLGERELFGYAPAFQPNRVSFATNGRPLIRDRRLNLQAITDDGDWISVSLLEVARQSLERQKLVSAAIPWAPKYEANQLFDTGPQTDERVVFDESCRAYTVVNANYSTLGHAFLLYSTDGGHSWAAFLIPGTGNTLYTVSIEAPVNGRPLHAPPALLIAQKYDQPSSDGSYPSDAHKAWLVLPVISSNDQLNFSGPFLVSDHTLCCGSHSGFEAQAVSYRDHIYIVYPGDHAVNDPIYNRLGTPQYIRVFSRRLGRFVDDPKFVGVGLVGPKNQLPTPATDLPDSHSQTALAIDRAGFIHLVIGGHGSRLLYRRSLRSDDDEKWSSPEIFTLQPRESIKNDYVDEYTYPSLVVDSAGQPHVVARWSGQNYVFRLVYTYRSNATQTWSPQQVLLDPGRAYYGVWYHKMTIDAWDRLFIDYSYYPDNLFADEAAKLSTQLGVELRLGPSAPACVATKSTASNPNYCHYLGYEGIGGAVLARRTASTPFELATTVDFLRF